MLPAATVTARYAFQRKEPVDEDVILEENEIFPAADIKERIDRYSRKNVLNDCLLLIRTMAAVATT